VSVKYVIIPIVAITFSLCGSASAEIIAEYTGTSNGGLCARAGWAHAMSFDVTGNHNVTEVQMFIERRGGSTGYAVMQLRSNSPGSLDAFYDAPSTDIYAQIPAPVTDLPSPADWVSFKWPTGHPSLITPGKYWIVLKLSPGSDAFVDWIDVRGNPYGNGADTLTSTDDGISWTVIQDWDAAFRVFGDIVQEDTNTTVTSTPGTVTVNGSATIEVEVKDSGGNFVNGPGKVNLTKTGGLLDKSTLTLNNGKASAIWTAPDSTGNFSVTADYLGHTFAGVEYNSDSNSTSINVIAANRPTTTDLTLSPSSTTTRSSIDVSVSVKDSCDLPVNGGTVSFSCSSGAFAERNKTVVSGSASTTWTASNDVRTFNIEAKYSGHNAGTIVYGASSSDPKPVSVDYTNVDTITTLRISPDYPYEGGKSYVIVEVKDSSNNPVPGSSVQLYAASGSFDVYNITVVGGRCHAIWHAPSTTGPILIIANYQQFLGGGNRYLASSDTKHAYVVQDTDSYHCLSWMSEWNTDYRPKANLLDFDYSGDPLDNSDKDARGFTNMLSTALSPWVDECDEYHNQSSFEWHMGSKENTYLDTYDFTYFSGHGGPDYACFITNKNDKQLRHSDAYDAWGDKDAEWIAFSACQIMSKDSYWASTMNGVHSELGWHTLSNGSSTFGGIFAGLLIKEGVDDEPHTVQQAWFLAGDQTNPNDRKQRVISENYTVSNDYIWGQGYVSPDPIVDDYYFPVSHDVNNHDPCADAGWRYYTTPGTEITLDANDTNDVDGGNLFYVWDTDITTNSDDGDWDLDDTDENDDDKNLSGRNPKVIFNNPGVYLLRLIVWDETYNVDDDFALVFVAAPIGSAAVSDESNSGPIQILSAEGLEIIDKTDPNNQPTETQMPLFQFAGTTIGYNEMMNLAGYYGMSGSATLDGVGSWNMVNDNREIMVNQYSGSVMFVDCNRAYIPYEPTVGLPPEAAAISIAQNFIVQNGICCPNTIVESVTDISYGEGQKGTRSAPSRIPFLRRVNLRRQMNVNDKLYPVVGPGGKLIVMMDESGDVIMFTKICRDMSPGPVEPLIPPPLALAQFCALGPRVLVGGSLVPPCNRIEINNISLGYYEDDFVTLQTAILPVYILDLRVDDDVSSQQVQVYMSALTPPLIASIDSAPDGNEVYYGETAAFTGSAYGGQPPYTYRWESDVDGFLGSEPNLTTSQLGVFTLEGEVLPHTISFTVKDAYGFENTAYAQLTVRYRCCYVDSSASGSNNGSSWADAYNHLQDALVDPCAVIWVADGTYKPDQGGGKTPGDRNASFALKNGVAIYGGFAGVGAPNPDARDVKLYETILSGDLSGNDVYVSAPCNLLTEPTRAENSYHVVVGSNTDTNAVLDGFTITAGNANSGAWPNDYGSGMFNEYNAYCTVNNCTFVENSTGGGGAIWNGSTTSLCISNCTFFRNAAGHGGGGIENYLSSPAIVNCRFISNKGCNAGNNGGGLYNVQQSSPTVTNCLFRNNSAEWGGGISSIHASAPTITNCTFSGNLATGGGCGGINDYNNSSPTIANCILWGNTAPQICDSLGSAATVNYSDVQGGWGGAGVGNTNADPLFVDADGPDDINGTEDDNLRLSPDSPCIDAGDNSAVPEGIETDLDGRPRFADGKCDGNDVVDMGAYEFSHAYLGDFNSDSDIDFFDFAILANSWVQNDPLRDIAPPPEGDGIVDIYDLVVLCDNWLAGK
jgi:hypothetical protein